MMKEGIDFPCPYCDELNIALLYFNDEHRIKKVFPCVKCRVDIYVKAELTLKYSVHTIKELEDEINGEG